jgi:predicted DNA-binding protein with PD1-like motif
VSGGHLAMGATVRTTAEVLVALLPAWFFRREPDPSTGFRELIILNQV